MRSNAWVREFVRVGRVIPGLRSETWGTQFGAAERTARR
jgi:hypothetical protein